MLSCKLVAQHRIAGVDNQYDLPEGMYERDGKEKVRIASAEYNPYMIEHYCQGRSKRVNVCHHI